MHSSHVADDPQSGDDGWDAPSWDRDGLRQATGADDWPEDGSARDAVGMGSFVAG